MSAWTIVVERLVWSVPGMGWWTFWLVNVQLLQLNLPQFLEIVFFCHFLNVLGKNTKWKMSTCSDSSFSFQYNTRTSRSSKFNFNIIFYSECTIISISVTFILLQDRPAPVRYLYFSHLSTEKPPSIILYNFGGDNQKEKLFVNEITEERTSYWFQFELIKVHFYMEHNI